jgi:UDP-GlcNAc:undecaprenyl-phosphate/decaprenyl-phosphate GlcNAc-1-phosphate transferase
MNFEKCLQYLPFVLTGILSYLLTSYSTPISVAAALKYNIVDKPDGRLKNQDKSVALLGGLAVLAGFILTISFTYKFNEKALGILLGGTIISVVGLLDDLKALTPKIKFFGQLIAVWVLVKAGIRTNLEILEVGFYIPQILSMIWLIAMINAFNIIDVMDGLATSLAFLSSLFFCTVAIINGREIIIYLSIAMAGSLLGFLKYNLPPAKIYLGDTGSMLIGLVLGSLALIGSYTKYNRAGFIAPLLILAIPIFDTLFVMYQRYKKRLSMFFGSPDHFVLRLRKQGFSVNKILFIANSVSFILGIAAIYLMYANTITTAIVIALTILLGILNANLLGKIEVERISSKQSFKTDEIDPSIKQ